MFRKAILTASTAIFAAGSAAAATSATAVTDLNLRAGPGPQYEIIGVIDAEAKASVDGCIEESNWCKVTYDGQEGWAYGNYLTAMVEETPTAVIAPEVTVGTVTYDSSKDGEAFAGAGTVGAVAGAYAQPDERVVTYVRTNTLDPIYLEGEVVRGAVVPESVELVEIPDAELRYVYINGQPVLVEPEQRTIVYVVR